MRPARLLFNPAAGGPGGERVLARLVAELTPAFTLRTVATASSGECRQEAAAAAAAGEEVVFVLGGDGTLRQAASALAGSATAVAPLPGGTTNVVARALGLPGDPVAAARLLATGQVREIDLGHCGDELFLMQASGGLDAEALAAVDPRWKRRFGRLAVAGAGLRSWSRYDFHQHRLEIDGEETAVTGFVLANLPRYAGAFEIVPGARPDDGRLELLLFRGERRRSLLGFALDLVRRRHTRRADVEVLTPRRIRLLAPSVVTLQVDGDPFVARPPLELGLAPVRLRLLAPAGAAPASGTPGGHLG